MTVQLSFRLQNCTIAKRGSFLAKSPTRALWQTNAVAPHVFLLQLKQFQFNIPIENRDLTGIRFCFTSLFALHVRVRKSLSNCLRYTENTKEWKSLTSAKSRLSPWLCSVLTVFWDVTPQTLPHGHQHFRGTPCLYLHSRIGRPQVLHGGTSHPFLVFCPQQGNTNDES